MGGSRRLIGMSLGRRDASLTCSFSREQLLLFKNVRSEHALSCTRTENRAVRVRIANSHARTVSMPLLF